MNTLFSLLAHDKNDKIHLAGKEGKPKALEVQETTLPCLGRPFIYYGRQNYNMKENK